MGDLQRWEHWKSNPILEDKKDSILDANKYPILDGKKHPILVVNKILDDKKHPLLDNYCTNSEKCNYHPLLDDYCSSRMIIYFWMKMWGQ